MGTKRVTIIGNGGRVEELCLRRARPRLGENVGAWWNLALHNVLGTVGRVVSESPASQFLWAWTSLGHSVASLAYAVLTLPLEDRTSSRSAFKWRVLFPFGECEPGTPLLSEGGGDGEFCILL